MKLIFPNPSRSFDADKSRIRFWGYDKSIEISFVVEVDALKQLCPDLSGTEAEFLRAFDGARDRIHGVADKAYQRGARGNHAYILAAKDF